MADQITTTLDHIEGISVPGDVFAKPANEFWALVCLRDGMEFLYRQARRCDEIAKARVNPDDNAQVFASGSFPHFDGMPRALLTCAFHWYAISACQYVRLVGAIGHKHENGRPLATEYAKYVIPEVVAFRDKVAAHFAWSTQNSRDNDAERLASIIPPLTFCTDTWKVGASNITLGSDSSEGIQPWSLCEVHEGLRERYWPVGNLTPAATTMMETTERGASDADDAARKVKVTFQTATAKLSAMPVTLTMRSYLSARHLWAARRFCALAKRIEDEFQGETKFDIGQQSYVTNALLSAVAFLEAAINELYQDALDNHESYIAALDANGKRLLADFWKMTEDRNRSPFSIMDKYQLALTFLLKPQFDTGKALYENASLVVALRNELMHYKPKSLGGRVEHKLQKKLRAKNLAENRLMAKSGNPWFPDKCLGHGCAGWAIESVVRFADEFFAAIDVVPNYQRADLGADPNDV